MYCLAIFVHSILGLASAFGKTGIGGVEGYFLGLGFKSRQYIRYNNTLIPVPAHLFELSGLDCRNSFQLL